jgi:hypothetical protein
MQQPVHPASSASYLIPHMPQHIPRIISILLHIIVSPSY